MSIVLSQGEVDALLRGVSGSEIEDGTNKMNNGDVFIDYLLTGNKTGIDKLINYELKEWKRCQSLLKAALVEVENILNKHPFDKDRFDNIILAVFDQFRARYATSRYKSYFEKDFKETEPKESEGLGLDDYGNDFDEKLDAFMKVTIEQ